MSIEFLWYLKIHLLNTITILIQVLPHAILSDPNFFLSFFVPGLCFIINFLIFFIVIIVDSKFTVILTLSSWIQNVMSDYFFLLLFVFPLSSLNYLNRQGNVIFIKLQIFYCQQARYLHFIVNFMKKFVHQQVEMLNVKYLNHCLSNHSWVVQF